ncbi:hypothetical protein [Asticcacaulis sp. YBE204]|uniref:hypothetical protein n=1 Tax=Asticcacaulis sp. YBE204 TaxID=1282363 RepID=UPI0003C40580|nr:hypothetical protein [Asticcacaulis sp. YBE204]ESQ80621.1 hypothetical protein AEYBE204_04950 [Asticcacaulis sp. YBE204]
MKKWLAIAAIAIGLSVAGQPVQAQKLKTFVPIEKPAEGASIIVVTPEISLGLLTMGGITEPKADWSKASQGHLAAAMTTVLKGKKYTVTEVNADTWEDPRALQILKLNDEVLLGMAMQDVSMYKLPTKTTFDWTLGAGVQSLIPPGTAAEAAPHYALFLRGKGSYQSSAKAAMNIGMAMLGGPMQFGGQTLQATLVDLRTGQVVWYEFNGVASGTDIREAEGATTAVATLFKDLPL